MLIPSNETAMWAGLASEKETMKEVVYLVTAILRQYKDEDAVYGPFVTYNEAAGLCGRMAARDDCVGVRITPVNTSDSPFVAPKRS